MSQSGAPGSLWQYALEAYQRPSVAEICLAFQDRFSADVNLLLTAGWLAAGQIVWRRAEIASLIDECADWRNHCVLPLRAVRRYLRGRTDESEVLMALYQQGKAMELKAERYQLSLIEDVINASPLEKSVMSRSDLLASNLDAYLGLIVADPSRCREQRNTLWSALSAVM